MRCMHCILCMRCMRTLASTVLPVGAPQPRDCPISTIVYPILCSLHNIINYFVSRLSRTLDCRTGLLSLLILSKASFVGWARYGVPSSGEAKQKKGGFAPLWWHASVCVCMRCMHCMRCMRILATLFLPDGAPQPRDCPVSTIVYSILCFFFSQYLNKIARC